MTTPSPATGDRAAPRPCHWAWLERVSYRRGLDLQQARAAACKQQTLPEALLLLEHPPVITLGRRADAGNLLQQPEALRSQGIEVYATGRGGDVTFHGPGQLVGYPIIDLKPDRRDLHRYVRDLEATLIRTAADFGVEAERVPGLTGIWVGREKLAAIGVRISRWVTSHGFALNVSTDLSFFDLIVPCGIQGRGITSLSRLLGRPVEMEEAAERYSRHFGRIFGREMVRCESTSLVAETGNSGQAPNTEQAAPYSPKVTTAPDKDR